MPQSPTKFFLVKTSPPILPRLRPRLDYDGPFHVRVLNLELDLMVARFRVVFGPICGE